MKPPFRVGTTSCIYPEDILPNVRRLAGRVDDIELVFFEIGEELDNLPDAAGLAELQTLAASHGMSYTVHLPLDLELGSEGERLHESLHIARRVIERTRPLSPWAYILHLAGDVGTEGHQWASRSAKALEAVSEWAGGIETLAVENLEGRGLDWLDPVLGRVPVSRCVDVGHLWLDDHDPVAYLERALARTRVVHLHGVGHRDHRGLTHTDAERVDRVLRCLLASAYRGVVTLEVFSEEDLSSSLAVIHERLAGLWVAG